jgi:hypothetical protein
MAPGVSPPSHHLETSRQAMVTASPVTSVSGRFRGKPFTAAHAEYDRTTQTLILRNHHDRSNGPEVAIHFSTQPQASMEGKRFDFVAAKGTGVPRIALRWSVKDRVLPQQSTFAEGYDLMLEFGEIKADRLPGHLVLKLSGDYQSELQGTFQALLR